MMMVATLRDGDAWKAYQPAALILTLSPALANRFKITPGEIAAIKAKGIIYQKHTINRREEMVELLGMGVESFLTDRPDLLAEVLAGRAQAAASE
jgi:glycerophosphoryl diester phosphodiesterase